MRWPHVAAAAAALAVPHTAAAGGVPAPPMVLPGSATAAVSDADPHTWLVGAKPTAAARALARRAGATHVVAGAFEVPVARARGLANRLKARGLLTFAEPNGYRHLAQRAVPDDPITPSNRWRDAALAPALVPPPVTPDSPLLALVDSAADVSHPEFGGAPVSTLGGAAIIVPHGTQTLGVAAAPANGIGIIGTYPGARALNVPLPDARISCADSARGIRRSVGAGAKVINMSYGSTSFCNTEFVALERAVHRRIVLVASGGNEGDQGNPFEFPASLPHVLTVGALAPNDEIPSFSNTNAALDLVAPGVGIVAPTPIDFDGDDGSPDGYESVAGTSFSSPIVAAAAQWLRAARPELSFDQVFQVIRLSATDIKRRGYDTQTGYGKLNLAAALQAKPPIRDPLEPNEDIPFVRGRVFRSPAKAIWTGRGTGRLEALLDYFEDPNDVYRLRVPNRRSVRITTRPDFGDPDIELYAPGVRHVGQSRHLLDVSRRGGTRTDRVGVVNRTGRTKTVFVRVFVRGRKSLDSRYTLKVS